MTKTAHNPPDDAGFALSRRGQWAFIWLLTLLGLLPILTVEHLPSHDGAAHVYLAQALRLYDDPALSALREYFEVNWNGQPNLFVYLVLQPLLSVASPAMAEKLLACAYVLLIPCATLPLAAATRLPALTLHVALWPMLYGFMFFFGFYNFCFGLLFAILGMAFWLRLRHRPNSANAVALFVLSIVGYFTHLFPVANLLLIVAIGSLTDVFETASTGKREFWKNLPTAFAAKAVRPGIALLPAFVLIIAFMAGREPGAAGIETDYGVAERITHLGLLSFNLIHGPADVAASVVLLIIFAAVYLIRDRRRARDGGIHPFAVMSGVYLALFFVVPGELAGSTFVFDRLLPFFYLVFVIWFVGMDLSRRQVRLLVFGLACIAVALPVYRAYQGVMIARAMQPFYALGKYLEPNRTLLSVRGASYPPQSRFWRLHSRVNVPLHAAAALAAERRLVNLKLVQANTRITPLRYRDMRNPYWYLPADQAAYPAKADVRRFENYRLEAPLPTLDFAPYHRRAGGVIDYLLVWGPVAGYQKSDPGRVFLKSVGSYFEPVPLAHGSADVRLFRRKGLNATQ